MPTYHDTLPLPFALLIGGLFMLLFIAMLIVPIIARSMRERRRNRAWERAEAMTRHPAGHKR